MDIVVLIKQVPSTANTRMDPETGVMIRDASETVLNPLDEHAITEAARIKGRFPGSTVTAITMGPPAARRVLLEACARGADRGILLSHKAFGGSDTLATSRVLAATIRKTGGFDLILAGEKATDGETGQTGPMTAAFLNLPVVTFVNRLDVEGDSIVARRIVEEGEEEVLVRLPALVTVVRDINNPPLPTVRQYVIAKKIIFPVWGPQDIGMEEADAGLKGSATRVAKIFSPRLSRNTTYMEAGNEAKMAAAATAILEVLKGRDLMKKGEGHGN
ncbi:MAG: electron transfer flavoprotein subunit beta/FixA family protein [Actinobacteria bacterium]|nr:electron transfer flavoprotein subunit beta/FixA family protein [Actinomycetota bacterium]